MSSPAKTRPGTAKDSDSGGFLLEDITTGSTPNNPAIDNTQIGEVIMSASDNASRVVDAQHALKAGDAVGEYVVSKFLGRGGMGEVYLATQSRLNRAVALKIVKPDLVQVPGAMDRYTSELTTLGSMESNHIILPHHAGEYNGMHYLAMEYAPGGDVQTLLANGPLELKAALRIAIGTAYGLRDAHSLGVVHRDVKPMNILLTRDGLPKLADFGLAKLMEGAPQLTALGSTLGTATHMPPEAIGKSYLYDQKGDQYAFGCVVFQLLAGRTPFEDGTRHTASDLFEAHATIAPPDLSELNTTIPPALAAAGRKMLQKNPDERFESMEQVIDVLQKILAGEEVDVAKLAVSAPKRMSPKMMVVALTACVAAAAAIIIPSLMRSRNENPHFVSKADNEKNPNDFPIVKQNAVDQEIDIISLTASNGDNGNAVSPEIEQSVDKDINFASIAESNGDVAIEQDESGAITNFVLYPHISGGLALDNTEYTVHRLGPDTIFISVNLTPQTKEAHWPFIALSLIEGAPDSMHIKNSMQIALFVAPDKTVSKYVFPNYDENSPPWFEETIVTDHKDKNKDDPSAGTSIYASMEGTGKPSGIRSGRNASSPEKWVNNSIARSMLKRAPKSLPEGDRSDVLDEQYRRWRSAVEPKDDSSSVAQRTSN